MTLKPGLGSLKVMDRQTDEWTEGHRMMAKTALRRASRGYKPDCYWVWV